MTSRFAAMIVITTPAIAGAQQIRQTVLAPADGTLRQTFSIAHLGMHELSDGRVLISDARSGRVVVADFGTGASAPVTGVAAQPLTALAADTSILAGLDGRWVFLVRTRPVGMLTRDNPVVRSVMTPFAGADTSGHLLADHRCPEHGDSTCLVVVDRRTAREDTISLLYQMPRRPGATTMAWMTFDECALAPDGWIAVVRAAPYRVDWRTPDGRWVHGAPIPVEPAPVTHREQIALLARRAELSGGSPAPVESITDWPDSIPAIDFGVIVAPDGSILVHRTPTADHPDPRYDIIDRQSVRQAQLTLPHGAYVMGFGAHHVYIGVVDDNSGQHVMRYRWP